MFSSIIRYKHKNYNNTLSNDKDNIKMNKNLKDFYKLKLIYGNFPIIIKTKISNNCLLGYIYLEKKLLNKTYFMTTPIVEGCFTDHKDICIITTKNKRKYIVVEGLNL